MKKGLRNKVIKFPRDMYVTSVGSFVIAEYMLGNRENLIEKSY